MRQKVVKSDESDDSVSQHHGYEFGGPIGTTIMSLLLPILVYAFLFVCNDTSGCPAPSLLNPKSITLEKIKQDINWPGYDKLFTTEAFLATFGWYAWSILLYTILPATEVEGTILKNGTRLKYRFNAFYSAIFTLSLLGAGTIAKGSDFIVWTFIYDNYIQLFTSNLLISFVLSVYVYISSLGIKSNDIKNKLTKREFAPGGNTGNFLYDWFIGRELNPRIKLPLIPEIDIKIFMEMRPGLLGWILFDLAFLVRQYKNYGYVTDSMLLTVISQTIYVLDGIYMEPAILTTIDIVTDGFGFMLSFGDVSWVPFIYSLQARYLSVYPVDLGPWIGLTFFVLGLGYYIFRSSNNEKNRFRTNPDDPTISHLEYMETLSGSKLLISGWWGTARHINYLGDWIMSWSYCFPTGIAGYQILKSSILPTIIPQDGKSMIGLNDDTIKIVYQGDSKGWGMIITYFFMIYFAVLLIHRERRDEAKCKLKYGEDWETYRKKVPSRIIPYVY